MLKFNVDLDFGILNFALTFFLFAFIPNSVSEVNLDGISSSQFQNCSSDRSNSCCVMLSFSNSYISFSSSSSFSLSSSNIFSFSATISFTVSNSVVFLVVLSFSIWFSRLLQFFFLKIKIYSIRVFYLTFRLK